MVEVKREDATEHLALEVLIKSLMDQVERTVPEEFIQEQIPEIIDSIVWQDLCDSLLEWIYNNQE